MEFVLKWTGVTPKTVPLKYLCFSPGCEALLHRDCFHQGRMTSSPNHTVHTVDKPYCEWRVEFGYKTELQGSVLSAFCATIMVCWVFSVFFFFCKDHLLKRMFKPFSLLSGPPVHLPDCPIPFAPGFQSDSMMCSSNLCKRLHFLTCK